MSRKRQAQAEREKERADKAARVASLDEVAVFFRGVGVADIEQSGLSIELLKLGVTSPKDLLLLDQVIALHNDSTLDSSNRIYSHVVYPPRPISTV